jgi:hypothetical protein
MRLRLTLPQIELIADAAAGRLWRHIVDDYTAGTHSHSQVTHRVNALAASGLLARGEDQTGGWLWRPTETARAEALAALRDLRDRIGLLRGDLDPTTAEETR